MRGPRGARAPSPIRSPSSTLKPSGRSRPVVGVPRPACRRVWNTFRPLHAGRTPRLLTGRLGGAGRLVRRHDALRREPRRSRYQVVGTWATSRSKSLRPIPRRRGRARGPPRGSRQVPECAAAPPFLDEHRPAVASDAPALERAEWRSPLERPMKALQEILGRLLRLRVRRVPGPRRFDPAVRTPRPRALPLPRRRRR